MTKEELFRAVGEVREDQITEAETVKKASRPWRRYGTLAACLALCPQQVWLMGAARAYMRRGLARRLPQCRIRELKGPRDVAPDSLEEEQVIFAVGNIANGGRELMALVREEGTELV